MKPLDGPNIMMGIRLQKREERRETRLVKGAKRGREWGLWFWESSISEEIYQCMTCTVCKLASLQSSLISNGNRLISITKKWKYFIKKLTFCQHVNVLLKTCLLSNQHSRPQFHLCSFVGNIYQARHSTTLEIFI